MTGRRCRVAPVCLAIASLVAGACARQRAGVQAGPPAPAPAPTASPAVQGQDHGLEIWYWVIADRRATPPPDDTPAAPERKPIPGPDSDPGGTPRNQEPALASPVVKPGKLQRPLPVRYTVKDLRKPLDEALRPFLDRPVPLSKELRERWRICGLRAVSVPVGDLPSIESVVRTVGPVQRQWFGEVTDWTDLMHGPHFDAGPAAGEDGVLRLEAGRLRLLGRCWSVPGAAGRGALRLELVPQHQTQLSGAQRLAAALEPLRRTEEQGTLYSRLSLGVTIGGDPPGPDAIVIVPEDPEADWNAEPPPPWVTPPPPAVPTVPTLGELMLSTPGTEAAPRTRAVVVLIPHPREKFGVLP